MGLAISQCKKCTRLYQPLGNAPYCPTCMEELEESFDLVKEYIYHHPLANAVEISQETGVPEKDIFYFLKEGRLSVSENSGMLLCESCGRSIMTGRYCESCKKHLERELSSSLGDAMQKKSHATGLGKMHVNIHDR